MSDGSSPSRKKRRWLRRLLIIFGILGVAVYFVFRDEVLQPVDDLMPQREVVAWDDHNGWKRLTDFARVIPAVPGEVQRRLSSVIDCEREPDLAEAKKLSLTAAQLTELEIIAAMPQFHARIFENTGETQNENYADLIPLGHLFRFTLVSSVEEGDIPLFLRCLKLQSSLQKKVMGGATTLISYVVGTTLLQEAAIARALIRTNWSETDLKKLADILADDPVIQKELEEAMRQEFQRSQRIFLDSEGAPDEEEMFAPSPPPKFLFQKNHTVNLMAKALRRDLELVQTVLWSEINWQRDRYHEKKNFLSWLDPNLYGKYLLGSYLVPASHDSTWRRANGTRRATRVIVALHRYHLAHGTPPSSLGALVPDYLPAIPLDPFDFEPLRWHAAIRAVQCSDYTGALDPPDPKQVKPISSLGSVFLFRTKTEEDARRASLPPPAPAKPHKSKTPAKPIAPAPAPDAP